jgi:hypothetical protein
VSDQGLTPKERRTAVSAKVWIPAVLLIFFPVGVLSAAFGAIAARKGFSRGNLASLALISAGVGGIFWLAADNPVGGYRDCVLSLFASAGLANENPDWAPNWGLYISLGIAVGFFLALWFAFAYRLAHADDEKWREAHPESPSWWGAIGLKMVNKKISANNERTLEEIRNGDYFRDGVGLGYVAGTDAPGVDIEPVGIPNLTGGSVSHSLVLGSSGRGKTVTLTRQAHDAIKQGTPVVLIDAKGDGDLSEKLGGYAQEYGRKFYHFSIPLTVNGPYIGAAEQGRAFYDPAGLQAGNHTRRRDFMMNARDWKGAPAVYSDKTRDWLSKCLWVDNAVAECNGGRPLDGVPTATFSRIAAMMSPLTTRDYLKDAAKLFGTDTLDEALGTITYKELLNEINLYVDQNDQTGESARMSHAAWLRTFMSSVTGPYLRDTGDDRTIQISRIVEEGAVCVFDLATDTYREEAPALARLVVADILSFIASSGKSSDLRLRVLLDEFAAVGGDDSANVLARARSAGVSFTLSTQTLSDLRNVSDSFEGQVLTNSLNILVHNASTWDEATKLAGMTGQIEQERRSSLMRDGEIASESLMMESNYRVQPDDFMETDVGELYKISQVERGANKAVKVKVVMPPPSDPFIYTIEPAAREEEQQSTSSEEQEDTLEPEVGSSGADESEVVIFDEDEEEETPEVAVDEFYVDADAYGYQETASSRRKRLKETYGSGPLFEPSPAEPVVAEPVVAEPVVAEPVVAEPVVAEPVENPVYEERPLEEWEKPESKSLPFGEDGEMKKRQVKGIRRPTAESFE